MATGHLGMSTIHAESVEAVINRLESEPMNIPKPLIAMTDVIMVITRTEIDGRPARRVYTTTELVELDQKTKDLVTEEVFHWDPKEDSFVFSGHSTILGENAKKLGISEEDIQRELYSRKIILEWLVNSGIRRHTDVANVIREYYTNPNRVFQKARVGLK
jgi:flagellar protein FlaI